MRKTMYLWSSIVLIVLILILAFENILLKQTFYILFYQVNVATTVIIMLAAVLGFLVGFFAMLYSVEVARLKKMAADMDDMGPPPTVIEQVPAATSADSTAAVPDELPPEKDDSKTDDFDEDDEVLG